MPETPAGTPDEPPADEDGPTEIDRAELIRQITARRAAGELVADIGHDYGLTPIEVLELLREGKHPDE